MNQRTATIIAVAFFLVAAFAEPIVEALLP